ncbi:MAG: VOC family protein [Blastocatellia bacterium]|nr:VOC family protein [Blastocatellia bacterium]
MTKQQRRTRWCDTGCFGLLFQLLLLALPVSAQVIAVDAPGFTVSDADRSVAFFQQVLSFEKVSDMEITGTEYEHLQGVFGVRMRMVRMKLGAEFIELTEYLAPKGKPIPADARSNDRSFQHIAIIVSDMEKAYQWLRKHKVTHVSTEPQRLPDWNKNASGIKAFYFTDPDGHALEVLEFPTDKGNPKWHKLAAANPNQLFLGIDHTAIVVSNTDASLKFYRDVLGMKVAGASENYGIEQERLNNVFGARLRITAIRAENGPGLEFLEYLTPRDGRPRPMDIGANDLLHWQTKLVTRDAIAIERSALMNKFSFVSSGVIALPNGEMNFAKSFLVRDPDGHVMQLIER